jgi:hypothetical protein
MIFYKMGNAVLIKEREPSVPLTTRTLVAKHHFQKNKPFTEKICYFYKKVLQVHHLQHFVSFLYIKNYHNSFSSPTNSSS